MEEHYWKELSTEECGTWQEDREEMDEEEKEKEGEEEEEEMWYMLEDEISSPLFICLCSLTNG